MPNCFGPELSVLVAASISGAVGIHSKELRRGAWFAMLRNLFVHLPNGHTLRARSFRLQAGTRLHTIAACLLNLAPQLPSIFVIVPESTTKVARYCHQLDGRVI